jgi:hypothetical protein
MATLSQMRRRLESVNEMNIASDSVQETKEALADINVEQMMSGKRSDGSDILPSYKDITIELKKMRGQPTDRVTLRDTGAFQAAIQTEVRGPEIITTSTDPKTEKLKKKYNTAKGSIFGLGGKYKQRYIDEDLQPEFIKNMKKATGLK